MSAQYYILEGSKPTGPFTWAQVMAQRPDPDTMIWREGLDGWTPITALSPSEEANLKTTSTNRLGMNVFTATLLLIVVLVMAGLWLLVQHGTSTVVDVIVDRIPTSVDEQLAVAFKKEVLPTYKIDTARTRKLQKFYRALGYNNATRVYVVYDSVVNAFALPDNTIVLYTEALEKINDCSALAALLAHEYIHINKRHTVRQLTAHLLLQVAIGVVTGGKDHQVLVKQAGSLLSLKGSREMEQEADHNGMELMCEKGLPPSGMCTLLNTLADLPEEKGNHAPDILSTHPATRERLKKAKDFAAQQSGENAITPELELLFQDINRW